MTGFSVLIYESLQERLTRISQSNAESVEENAREHIEEHVNEVIKKQEEAHSHIEEHVEDAFRRLEELLEKTEKEAENRQILFKTQMLRSLGYTFWKLFRVWEEVKEIKKETPPDSHVKKVSNDLIKIAIERAKLSLESAEELPENEYKMDIYRAKNNWVYFLAEADRIEGFEVTKQDKEQALNFINEILAEVSEKDYPMDYYEYQESCAWALQHLSEDEDKNKQKAGKIIHKLLNNENIPPTWIKEHEEKWAPFLNEENETTTLIKNAQ